jgi:anaphase-promoting complex subunit 6
LHRVHEGDPYNVKVVPIYVATMVELSKKRDLYQYAHHLVDVYPKKACSWYTVGCYYLLIQKFDAAQRYFQ